MNITALAVLQNGKYALNSVLGEGRLGITYRGTQTQFGQPVVIKTLKKSLSYHVNFVRLQQQFITKARAIANIQHPHIVRILDLFEEAGMPYIVMDYIPGQTLADFVKPGQLLPEAKAVHYIRQIAEAVSFVHQKGLVLRNIKPHNIIRRQGTDSVALISFGISHEFTDGMMHTPTGILSTGYFPIEPYLPDSTITPATDIYSLAASLYYFLTGHPPISAKLGRSEAVSADIRHPFPELRKFQPHLSPVVEQAILRGLEIVVEKRLSKVEDWLALLPSTKEQKGVQVKGGNNKNQKIAQLKTVNNNQSLTPVKVVNNSQSPTPVKVVNNNQSPSPVKVVNNSQSPTPVKVVNNNQSPSPVQVTSKNPSTVQMKVTNNNPSAAQAKAVNNSSVSRSPSLPVLPRFIPESQKQILAQKNQENVSKASFNQNISNDVNWAENNYSSLGQRNKQSTNLPNKPQSVKKKKRQPAQRKSRRTDKSVLALSRWKLLLITSVITSSVGAGFGLSLRFNAPLGGSTLLHSEQSFPPRQDWPVLNNASSVSNKQENIFSSSDFINQPTSAQSRATENNINNYQQTEEPRSKTIKKSKRRLNKNINARSKLIKKVNQEKIRNIKYKSKEKIKQKN